VSCKIGAAKGKPDRRIYSIAKKGRERLANWLAVEPQPEIPRNELLLKCFFARRFPRKIFDSTRGAHGGKRERVS